MSFITGPISAVLGSQAAGKAAGAQERAAAGAQDVSWRMFKSIKKMTRPQRKAARWATKRLLRDIRRGPGKFKTSPGYEFRLSEGLKALERGAAARGGLISGRAMKEAERYGQRFATEDYDNFLRRYYEKMNPLMSLVGMGQVATGQTAGVGQATASSVGNALMAGGAARAGGYINRANAITGGLQATSQGIQNLLGLYFLGGGNLFGGGTTGRVGFTGT